jgi:Na+-driven multidrug efflux pump
LPIIELPTAILKTMTTKPSSISRKAWVSLMLSIALLPPSIQCFSPIAYKLPLITTINKISLHESRNNNKIATRFDLRNIICGRPSYTALSSTKTSSSSSIDDQSNDEQNKDYGWTSKNLELAVPALIGMLADPLLSLMDTAYVGRVGPIELAALGACTSIFHLAFNAFRATTAATTSLVGNAKSEEEKREIVKISLLLGVVLGVIVMAILEKAGPWCLGTMGIPRDSPLFKPGIAYLGTRLYAAPAVMAIVVSEGAFRGYGDTKIPLLASMVASCINLVLDPVLMFTLGLGVKGAAAATVISQLGAAVIYVHFLRKRNMLPSRTASSVVNKSEIVKTILGANVAMVCKQGSLLLAWAYATARATR